MALPNYCGVICSHPSFSFCIDLHPFFLAGAPSSLLCYPLHITVPCYVPPEPHCHLWSLYTFLGFMVTPCSILMSEDLELGTTCGENMWSLSPESLTIIFSRFWMNLFKFHFSLQLNNIPFCLYITFFITHSTVEEHLGCFHILSIVNRRK